MRAIDADAFAEFLKDAVKQCKYEDTKIDGLLTVADVIEAIISELNGTSLAGFKNAPTIESERKKGKWLPENRTIDAFWVCSSCGFPSEAHAANILYNFCPNCGADMRE